MRTVAAGHPATADAAAEILEEGGCAADGAIAACLASCVAESVMTGLLGGGHAIYFDAASGRARNLDFFVGAPGLGSDGVEPAMTELEIPFGTELVHYAVGIGSCAVPGVPAGLDSLWQAHGRAPWRRLVEPALRLANGAVPMPEAHAACLAMLAPVMTMNEGERIYSPGGALLAEGDPLRQPGLVHALEALAEEGPRAAYEGTIGSALLELMAARGGSVTADDLQAYEARWSEPLRVDYCGHSLLTRAALMEFAGALAALPPLRGLDEAARALATAGALGGVPAADSGTTNFSIADEEGNACVLTTSLGLGSGDFVPGYDLHLNSMLGEADLLTGPLVPGERMASMMSPSLALDAGGVALAAGAAGGTRLRSALVQVVSGVLDEGLELQAAVDRPRLHAAGPRVHLEGGFDPTTVDGLVAAGFEVQEWPGRHHYFGGVSAVGRSAAAGDPRRSGASRVL